MRWIAVFSAMAIPLPVKVLRFCGSEPAFGGEGRRLGERAAKGAGGKRRQGLDRGGGIGAGAGQGFGQGAVPLDKPESAFEIARALLALFQGAAPEGALLAVAARISEDDRQGDLAVAEIVADRFPELARVRREIEHVVDQLIGDPEIAPEAPQRFFLL